MRLSVSNIAWEPAELEAHLILLKDLGCDGVEIAPSCVWSEPVDISVEEIKGLRDMVFSHGLSIPAIHALLYTRPDLYLFGDGSMRRDTVKYLKELIRLAGSLSAGVLVYGSPASRRVGERPYAECYALAVDSFRELGKEASLYDTVFCIEPLAPSESDFICSADEGHAFVQDIGHPNIGLHLDARAMVDAGEDFGLVFGKYGNDIKHFHVGDKGLAPPGHTGFDHAEIGACLSRSAYTGFVSIEMKRGFGNSMDVVKTAVKYVREKYFPKGES